MDTDFQSSCLVVKDNAMSFFAQEIKNCIYIPLPCPPFPLPPHTSIISHYLVKPLRYVTLVLYGVRAGCREPSPFRSWPFGLPSLTLPQWCANALILIWIYFTHGGQGIWGVPSVSDTIAVWAYCCGCGRC